MTKKGVNSGNIETQTENWNVADIYAKIKIMRILQFFDDLDRISRFGTIDISDINEYSENFLNKKRVEALERYHEEVLRLIRNTYFAVKKESKETFESYKKRLENIREYFQKCYIVNEGDNYNDEKIEIKEKLFEKIREILNTIV